MIRKTLIFLGGILVGLGLLVLREWNWGGARQVAAPAAPEIPASESLGGFPVVVSPDMPQRPVDDGPLLLPAGQDSADYVQDPEVRSQASAALQPFMAADERFSFLSLPLRHTPEGVQDGSTHPLLPNFPPPQLTKALPLAHPTLRIGVLDTALEPERKPSYMPNITWEAVPASVLPLSGSPAPGESGEARHERLCGSYSSPEERFHGMKAAWTISAGLAYSMPQVKASVIGIPLGTGCPTDVDAQEVLRALKWAATAKLDVLNISMGLAETPSGKCTASMQTALDELAANGTTVVVAAGNVSERPQPPATCKGVIVAGTESASMPLPRSNPKNMVYTVDAVMMPRFYADTGSILPPVSSFRSSSAATAVVSSAVALLQARDGPLPASEVGARLADKERSRYLGTPVAGEMRMPAALAVENTDTALLPRQRALEDANAVRILDVTRLLNVPRTAP